MNGAHAIIRTLQASGIDTCFANPGTSEMHLVAALGSADKLKCVLGLTESVVTGAADGYARMTDMPAATLLHCGPGLANGIANLHNARRARSPVLNLVGDQASYHAPLDPPLAFETENLARTVSGWTRVVRSAHHAARDVAAGIAAAREEDQIATVILPSDVCWTEGAEPAASSPIRARHGPGEECLRSAAESLRSGSAALLLGGKALRGKALELAGLISEITGAPLFAPSANARIERGAGRPAVRRLPYSTELARDLLARFRHLILIDSTAPVAFFAYPSKPQTPLSPETSIHALCGIAGDAESTLRALLESLPRRPNLKAVKRDCPDHGPATGPTSARALAASLTALLCEQSIIVDESVSLGRDMYQQMDLAAPNDWLQLTGGAIGAGLPLSTGAAIGAPGRRVITLQADGSALYSVQALWTQARLNLDVTTVILSNRKYATLYSEMGNVGAILGSAASELFDLEAPAIGWCSLANGFGVDAATAATMDEFNNLFAGGNKRRGPFLIELLVDS